LVCPETSAKFDRDYLLLREIVSASTPHTTPPHDTPKDYPQKNLMREGGHTRPDTA
jgi:hypothetical protein